MMTKLDQREESKRYYVKFVEEDGMSYLKQFGDGSKSVSSLMSYSTGVKTLFTKAEIMAINPNYMLFAVPVEDNND